MHEEEDVLNVKAILLAIGGAAAAGLLFVLARRDDAKEEPAERVEAAAEKAGKKAKKKRKKLAASADAARDQIVGEFQQNATAAVAEAQANERDLKAAAWDAQQRAREAESRLRAAGLRVVDDASHLASRVGSEARHLAGESRERLAHLRQRDDGESAAEREIARLRAEIDDLREQLAGTGTSGDRDFSAIASRLTGKGGGVMATDAAAAALTQLEQSLKAKAPALLAAKNRGQVLDILQQELGPTLRETLMQAATAALSSWEAAREEGAAASSEARHRAAHLGDDVRDAARKARDAARNAADDAREAVVEGAEEERERGRLRFWRHDGDQSAAVEDAREAIEEAVASNGGEAETAEEHRGKAGLFWGGAGLGLALYAMLDAERREHVLRLANEASIQVQELVRDLQGYDDEF